MWGIYFMNFWSQLIIVDLLDQISIWEGWGPLEWGRATEYHGEEHVHWTPPDA
jgi:hypothetical protein